MTKADAKKKAFLEALSRTANVTLAAQAADVPRPYAYEWRNKDDKFAAGWYSAMEAAADYLEAEARRRAAAGSDVLLIFLLKGARPEKYRERHDVKAIHTVHHADEMTDNELASIAAGGRKRLTAATNGTA